MVKNLISYPDPTIRLISGNVRFFNDELKGCIADMIDTMKANNLDALSAIFIGVQYNIIVIKENDEYKPYVNASLIKQSGMSTQTERSIYYDGISVDVDRFENVTVVYEDENGNERYKELNGDNARVFQRQLDYCFGSTFVDRVDKEVKQRINDHLEHGLVSGVTSACPIVFVRDYFKRGARYLMGLTALSFITPFLANDGVRSLVFTVDKYAIVGVVALIIIYFFYAQYESRVYKQCTSCQIGNIIGTVAILALWLIIVSLGVFFWVAPS